jgi:hypothetical protein
MLNANWQDRFQVEPKKLVGLQDVRDKAARDNLWFIEKNLVIATTKRKDAKLILNHSQRIVWDKIQEKRLLGIPLRLVILKSRQVGISTLIAGLLFCLWWAERNLNALLIAHLKQVTANLFKKNKKFYAELPPHLRIPLERSNKQELIQDMAYGGSQLFLATAGSPHEARSQTLHYVEGSEAAFYPDLKELKNALEASVPEDPETGIFWESTAFGAGTEFHELYKAGLTGDSIYESMFLEWFKDPECCIPDLGSDLIRHKYLEMTYAKAPHLKDRREHFGLSVEQIVWYAMRCANKYGGEWLKMQQEFPCDAQEAFLATGATIIPTWVIESYKNKTRDGIIYDPLTLDFGTEYHGWKKDGSLERGKHTYLEVFEPPQPKRHYLIVMDTASGQAADYSCALVLDIVTQNLCAELHGKIDPKKFAELGCKIGTAYNTAVMCIEVTGLGLATQSHAEDKYFHMYRRRSRGSVKGVTMTDKVGWDMNEELRWVILANLRRLMIERLGQDEHPEEFMPSKGLNDEMSTFIQPPTLTQKPQAEKGCNDDRVIAMAIGCYACLEEIQMRPDIAPIDYFDAPADNRGGLDLDRLNAMVDDPNWYGQADHPALKTAAGPFIAADLRDDDFDLEDYEFD